MTAVLEQSVATREEALAELAKFFTIATFAGEKPGMFSRFIDEQWHRLAESSEYAEFCRASAGAPVVHDPTCGEGEVAWLDLYHDRFGPLPAVWFADEAGRIDRTAYESYRGSGTVHASWNCSADTGGDPDFGTPKN
jgi:hypothetical protein